MPLNRHDEDNPDWRELEILVADHYKSIGYKVTADVNLNGSQIDLVCEKHFEGFGLLTLAVEVKHRRKESLGIGEVRKFKSVVQDLKNENIVNSGVMVSNVSYTQDAQASVYNCKWIKLLNIEDLEQDLFNFTESLLRTKIEYEADPIMSLYVPLASTWKGQEHTNTVNLLHEIIRKDSLAILVGDFGSGKTTLLDHFFYELVCKRLLNSNNKFPVKLKLRGLLQYTNIWDFVLENLKENQYLIPTKKQFQQRLKDGSMVLLLDGFDEIKTIADENDRALFLERLAPLLTSNCNSLLSTRPTYFESLDNMINLVSSRVTKSDSLLRVDTNRMPVDEIMGHLNIAKEASVETDQLENIIQLIPMSEETIFLMLDKHKIDFMQKCGVTTHQVYDFLKKIYDLPELMKRPMLLDMVRITVISGAIDLNSQDEEHVGPSMLYDTYTQLSARRDIETRPSGLKIEERLEACRALAIAMFIKGAIELTGREVLSVINELPFVKNRFEFNSKKIDMTIEEILTDIRVCSFLSFSKNSSLRFAHKSFYEFFIAQHVYVSRLKDFGALRHFVAYDFTYEILYFLGSYARDQPEFQLVVKAGVNAGSSPRQDHESSVSRLCRQIVFCAGTILEGLKIKQGVIEGAELKNLELADFSMEEVLIENLILRNMACETWSLINCKLIGSIFTSASFTNSKIDVECNNTEWDELHFEKSNVNLRGNKWVMRNLEFEECTVSVGGNGKLIDVMFANCDMVSLDNLRLGQGASFKIESSKVTATKNDNWCSSKSHVTIEQSSLVGLSVPDFVVSELLDASSQTNPILRLCACEGILFCKNDLDEMSSGQSALFKKQYPKIDIISPFYISRAVRKLRGENVEDESSSYINGINHGDKSMWEESKAEISKLKKAKRTIERHDMVDDLSDLYDVISKAIIMSKDI